MLIGELLDRAVNLADFQGPGVLALEARAPDRGFCIHCVDYTGRLVLIRQHFFSMRVVQLFRRFLEKSKSSLVASDTGTQLGDLIFQGHGRDF